MVIMKKQTALDYFGSVKALADFFEISVQAVYLWGDELPPLRALQLEKHIRDWSVNGPRRRASDRLEA